MTSSTFVDYSAEKQRVEDLAQEWRAKARATNGQAAAPPSVAMNARRPAAEIVSRIAQDAERLLTGRVTRFI